MTTLVTGATGFIGGHVAERLAGEGRAVRCLVRAGSDTSLLDRLGVELVLGELTDPDSLARATAGCRRVVHCAAMVSDWGTVAEIRRANVEGTRNLLDASLAGSVERFVHFSTTDVHGPPNWYARTKRESEAEVRATRLDAVILRPATVYGPRSADVVGAIARAIRGGHMLLIGGGRADAGLCHVDNVVDAAVLALDHEAAPGETFEVTDEIAVTWRQFVDDLAQGLGCRPVRWSMPYPIAGGLGFVLEHGYRLLRRATGLSTPPLLSRQAVAVLGRDQTFSARRAREVLGWAPRVDYATGLASTLAWLNDVTPARP